MTETANSSTSVDRPVNHSNEEMPTPLRIEPISSSTYHKTECPKCGFIIDTRNKHQLKSAQIESVTEEEWTTEKLIDELFLHLIGVIVCISNDDGVMFVVRKYKQHAKELFWRIPAGKPVPAFKIVKSDLTPKFRKELVDIISRGGGSILKEAVGRIFEEVDFRHYHLSVAKNLRVRSV